MKCPKCEGSDVKVIDSRISRDGYAVRRRRECSACEHRFTTLEEIVPAEITVVKRDESRVDFDPAKIREGIKKACWKRPVTAEQLDATMARILQRLEAMEVRELPSKEIGELVMEALADLDQVAYVRFASVYRQFKDTTEFIQEIQSMKRKEDDRAPAVTP